MTPTLSRAGRPFGLAPALALLLPGAAAQESGAPFDAPVVLIGETSEPFRRLLDFNGDGAPDVVGYLMRDDGDEFRARAWRNDGQGALDSVWSEVAVPPPGSSFAVGLRSAAGDWTGDGLEEFVLSAGTGVRVYASTGSGFVLAAIQSGAETVYDVAMADLDGDELDEILALRQSSVVVTWGKGGVSQAPNAIGAGRLLVLDTDGDGSPDFAGVQTITRQILPYRVEAGAISTYPAVDYDLPLAKADAGDVDGDGLDDFVFFGHDDYQVVRGTGPGTYAVAPVQDGGPAEFLFDADGDGDLDGVCCAGGGGSPPTPHYPLLDFPSKFEVALNDGSGQFDDAFDFPGLGSNQLAGVADLDADGDPDFVAGRVVYYSRGVVTPDSMHLTGAGIGGESILGDGEGDGDVDTHPNLVTGLVSINDGRGYYTSEPVIAGPAPANHQLAYSIFYGDFTGDGHTDVITRLLAFNPLYQFVRHVLFANNGGGGYGDPVPATAVGVEMKAGSFGSRFLSGDAEDDGDLDIATTTFVDPPHASSLWLNDGSGFFTKAADLPNYRIEYFGDVDADGVDDLVLYTNSFSTGFNRLYLRRGLGAGAPEPFGPDEDVFGGPPVHAPARPIDFADFNDDGYLDLGYVADDGTPAVLLNPAALGGGPAFLPVTPFPGGPPAGSVANPRLLAVDFDADGWTDVVHGPFEDSPGTVALRRRVPGSAGLLDAASYEAPVYQLIAGLTRCDSDGDGDVDLIGGRTIRNVHFDGPEAGSRRQYGQGSPGAGGMAPTLGATGPFRVGETVELRLRATAPGAPGVLALASAEASLPAFLGPGGPTVLVDVLAPGLVLIPLAAPGVPGLPGSGHWEVAFTVTPGMAGAGGFYHQAFVVDLASPSFLAASGGLELIYGG